MPDLEELRQEIDRIDDEIRDLFLARLEIVQNIATYKQENSLPISHPDREQNILTRLTAGLSDKQAAELTKLYEEIFRISRDTQ